jgi:hypothetical protein
MKRLMMFLFLAVFFPLSFFACKDDPGLTDPTEAIDPSLGKFQGPQDAGALRVTQLIEALYPDGGLENSALNRWNNIQRQMDRGQVNAAQSQMMALADQVTRFMEDDVLVAPDDPALPPTLAGAVAELVTRLFIFVDLESSDALAQFPESMPEDYGAGVIEPDAEEPTVITTGNNWAAVVAPVGAVSETGDPVYITIELLDQETCEVASPLTQALGCWEITRFPDEAFEEDVTVEMCVADNPLMTDDEWNLLLLHKKEDNGEITALPWVEPSDNIDCGSFTVDGGPDLVAGLPSAQSRWQSLGKGLADFLLPEPLGASFKMASRPPKGLGGLTGSFSEFFGAVPESAKEGLVTWWSADGHFYDMYGGNHGTPGFNVSFEQGISGDAFSFDGAGDHVNIETLSDPVTELQDLTVSAWVKLDESGPGNQIQRFVTLGTEKAVLRQEGGFGSNRMLHFYMNFGTESAWDLHAIRVNNAFQVGCYHFFAGTYGTDGYMRAYLDGEEVGSEYVSGTSIVGGPYGMLGASGDGSPDGMAEELHGALDEVMIFDEALSPAEIQGIYDAGGSGKCAPGVFTAQTAVDRVSGAHNAWFSGTYSYYGLGMALSTASFQHNSPWSNSGMLEYRRLPRVAIVNDASDPYYDELSRAWVYSYWALNLVADGLRALEDPVLQLELTADELNRVRAFGKFVQGMAHATIATLYPEGPILDEDTDLSGPATILAYNALMDQADGYFDEAISLSQGASWTLPFEWMRAPLMGSELARAAHSMRARYRAGVARNPTERAAVNWGAVIADIDAGITEDLLANYHYYEGWRLDVLDFGTYSTWSQLAYFIHGMADQYGDFQAWEALDLVDKSYELPGGDPVLIVTPDLRFPQGATIEDQRASQGSYFGIVTPEEQGNTWKRPDRGTWGWSWYKQLRGREYYDSAIFDQPEIRMEEMNLLKAEALFHLPDLSLAANYINITRTAAGLNATDASGTNTSCVPKLPDGSCGDLFEMLKWEKRMETSFTGLMGVGWFWDSRGWGDLWKDTPLQLPVPCNDAGALGLPCLSFGGPGGSWSAPVSTYGWNGEGG